MAVLNLASTVSSIPIATRGLTAALLFFTLFLALLRLTLTPIGLHVISFSKDDSAVAFPWLVIVPGSSFLYPWTLITSAFCETTLIEFLISAVSLPLAGRYLERIWGPLELVRFSAIVIVGSNIIAWFIALVLFAVTRGEVGMYGTQYHGLEALQTGFLVALAQLIPEHQIQLLKGAVRIRVRDLPMAYVTFSNITCLLGYPSPFILIQFGWLLSWAYLRFFKPGEGGIRGDRSETFSFVSWFPPFLHTPVTFISNFLYGIFIKLGVVQPWHYSALGDVELGVGAGLPGMAVGVGGAGAGSGGASGGSGGGQGGHAGGQATTARQEAERRRAMALKALDQRVKAGAAAAAAAGSSPASSNSAAARAAGAGTGAPPRTPTAEAAAPPHQEAVSEKPNANGTPTVPKVVVSDLTPADNDHSEAESSGDIGVTPTR